MPTDINEAKVFTHTFNLFKGDPGTAKSPAACTYPEPYMIDLDGRINSIISYYRGKRKIMYDTIVNDYPRLISRMDELDRYCPYGTVILDSLTTLARSLQVLSILSRGEGDSSSRKDKDAVEIAGRMVGGKVAGFKGVPLMEIQDYRVEHNGIVQILEGLRSIWSRGINVIIIGHVISVEQPQLKGAPKITRALMTGGRKVAAEIPVYFDEAYHFAVETGMSESSPRKYKAFTRNAGDEWAKTTLPIPDEIDFTDQSLYEIIKKHIDDFRDQNPGYFEDVVRQVDAL